MNDDRKPFGAKSGVDQVDVSDSLFGISHTRWLTLAAVVGVVMGAVTLGKLFFSGSDGPHPHATFRVGAFYWPMNFVEELGVMCTSLSQAYVRRDDPMPTLTIVQEASRPLQDSLYSAITPVCETPRAGEAEINSTYWGYVTNKGNDVATSVSVRVPQAVTAFVGGSASHTVEGRDAVDIGSLRPGESVLVIVWSERPPDISPFGSLSNNVALLHAGGEASVDVLGPTTPFLQLIYERIGIVPGELWILIFGVLALLIGRRVWLHFRYDPREPSGEEARA